jgi:hypothetical protein
MDRLTSGGRFRIRLVITGWWHLRNSRAISIAL